MHARLQNAVQEFQILQKQLLGRDELDRLDDLGRQTLRDCYFEIAHTYYALSEYDRAIVAYGSAANKFADDPQVLLAYMQMSNCYGRLGRLQEAQSMLEQAKVVFSQMPDDVFQRETTNMTRKEWRDWLDWARQLRHPVPSNKLDNI
jgi:tetratricopeptide (TPR) repeat protein